MKRTLAAGLMAGLLLLSACAGPAGSGEEDHTFTVAAMTYPVYLFASRVMEGAENAVAEAVVNQPMSCLHDYTMTVTDMKNLQGADILLLNGVGLEDLERDAQCGYEGAFLPH